MNRNTLLIKLDIVNRIALSSKFLRMAANPFNYWHAILYREIIYRFRKKEKQLLCNTFYGIRMNILLPSSIDIYLTGGKSHVSEINLARFLILHLFEKNVFFDIGAHYGYFSMLAAKLVGETGTICAFEASPQTFAILQKNAIKQSNVEPYHVAVSDQNSIEAFYQFPNLYAEYNSLRIENYQTQHWYQHNQPEKLLVNTITLDSFIEKTNRLPNIIKIDVEGCELKVIRGLANYLSTNSPIIVMEFIVCDDKQYEESEKLLYSFGFQSHYINHTGELVPLTEIKEYMKKNKLYSENIVFKRIKHNT